MNKFWDFVVKKPVSALLNLGQNQAHRIAIHPNELAVAHATQHGQDRHNDPHLGQGANAMSSDNHEEPSPTNGRHGCRQLAKKVGIVVGVLVVLTICGVVLLATAKFGPEILYAVACCLSCLGGLAVVAGGYMWLQKRFGHMIPGTRGQ